MSWGSYERLLTIMQCSGGLSYCVWGAIRQYSRGRKYGGGLSCSTVEGGEYGGGLSSVQWRVQVRLRAISQYSGGLSFSTVEGAKYNGWQSRSTVQDGYHCGGTSLYCPRKSVAFLRIPNAVT